MVNGRAGREAKATSTAISNNRRGSGDEREEEATAVAVTAVSSAAVGLRDRQAHQPFGALHRHSKERRAATIAVGHRPRNTTLMPDGGELYPASGCLDGVSVIDIAGRPEVGRYRGGRGAVVRGGGAAGRGHFTERSVKPLNLAASR
jgi:hypothetical protein